MTRLGRTSLCRCRSRFSRRSVEYHFLHGTYSWQNFSKLRGDRLEALFHNLISYVNPDKSSKDKALKRLAPPEWWPKDHSFYPALQGIRSIPDGTKTLRKLLRTGYEYYKKTPIGLCTKRDEIILIDDGIALYGTDDEPKKVNKRKIQVRVEENDPKKDEFLNNLNLGVPSSMTDILNKPPTKVGTSKYNPAIPFSSDLGKLLISNDRYVLSIEMYSRKTVKTEHYVNQTPVSVKEKTFDVSYNKNHGCDHLFKFPKRQYKPRLFYVYPRIVTRSYSKNKAKFRRVKAGKH